MSTRATPRTTRAAVARAANVSTAVVSYVVNSGPRPVAASTRDRVLRVIDELGYQPNAIARALRRQRTDTYGIIVPDNSNPFFAEFAKAIEDAAYARSHALVLGNSSNDPQREQAQLRALVERQVDGLLLISANAHPDLAVVRRSDVPLVLLDRIEGTAEFPSLSVDNEAGAYEAVQHLVRHGHTRIAFLAGAGHSPAALDRQAGWGRALNEAAIGTAQRIAVRTEFTRRGGYQAMMDLLSRRHPPTAIFAATDIQAVGALRACHETGRRVPDDLAMIAFDGTQESEFTNPPLSVVEQPVKKLAETALALLQQGRDAPAEHLTITHRFVARRSCGCT